MKFSKAIKVSVISLSIIAGVSVIGIRKIVMDNREEARRIEQARLEKKVENLEEKLKNKEDDRNISEESTCTIVPNCTIEGIHDHNSVDDDIKESENENKLVSAKEMYQNAISEYSHLAVNRFFNYYIAVYDTIERNYDNYSAEDMYQVSDMFLNALYGDMKNNGGISEEILQEQRAWVDYKLSNFDKSDFVGLYTYTMKRCYEFIEIYK